MKKIIDISEHNGTIDFKKVKNDGIKDVIIRIGWVGNKKNHTIDKKFEEYYKKAKENDFNIGFYVYSYCKNKTSLNSGIKWVKEQIKNKDFNLPLFIDLEDEEISSLSKANLTNQAIQFCESFDCKTGVYANLYWFNNKLNINQLVDYKIWLAQYTTGSNHFFKYKVDLWQYTSTGKIDGIKGNVDISKCMCDCKETKDNKEENQKGEFEVAKKYKNGSTPETVFADSGLTIKIGQLNKNATCECLGVVNGRYIVKYKVNNSNNYKVGFVKYNGGVN